jgi:soluble cytochrome b562
MKNKNETNYTVAELTNKIKESCDAKYPNDPSMKWAYTCGVLEAILDWEVKGYNKGFQSLQETINQSYLRYEQELLGELELAASRD